MEPAKSDLSHVTVAVGLSGGVDSAVAALLLKQQGYRVLGVFMKNWDEPDSPYCTSESDARDVAQLCSKLDIELVTLNFVKEYQEQVFKSFIEAYHLGHTPNPDVLCNQEIKFNAFYKACREMGADKIATGHYAGVSQDGVLLKAKDQAKDQTYFLYRSPKEALSNTLFPLASLTKTEVRELALKHGLHVHKKKDSTGVCFIGERPFNEFLKNYVKSNPGPMVDLVSGQVVGQHTGLPFYTLGQRKGMGLGGEGKPYFVVKKDLASNALFVVRGDDHPALYATHVTASDLSLLKDYAFNTPYLMSAKVRYRQPEQSCTVFFTKDNRVRVIFSQPQRAVTPGQSLVLYEGDSCVGGGIITNAESLESAAESQTAWIPETPTL